MSGSERGLDLSPLLGNEGLKRQLDAQTLRRGLSHAYILSGPAGTGRHTLAALLAQAMVCGQTAGTLPCGACSGCRKAAAGIHPDILRVGGDGKDITVAQVREMRADAYIRPNEAPRKVYLISDAQTMNPSAQNAMLKLLEEGPAYAAFLLITENAGALLPTVRSRCEGLLLSPLTPQQALEALRARFPDRPAQEVQQAALACEGRLGRGIALLEGSVETDATVQTAARLLTLLAAGDERGLAELCIGLEKWERNKLLALLEEGILLIRDALVRRTSGLSAEPDPVRRQAAEQAAALPPRQLLAAAAHLERLRDACGCNIGTGHLAGWLCAGLCTRMD